MCNCNRLSPLALGLALGILMGLSMLLVGLSAHFWGYGRAIVEGMGVLYIGYEPSILGSVIGGLMGFIDSFITGVLIAWLYNIFNGCCTCCCKPKSTRGSK